MQYSHSKVLRLKAGTVILLDGQFAVIVKGRGTYWGRVKAHKENCKNPTFYNTDKVEMVFTNSDNCSSTILKLIKKYKQ